MSAIPEIRVLVVDDDIEIYELLCALLSQSSRAHYRLEYLDDVTKVKARVESGSFDITLVDQNLGQSLSGLDLIKECASSLVPFVLVTSDDRDQLDYEALKADAAGFILKKDLSTSVLDRTIRYAMARLKQIRDLLHETNNHRKMALTDTLTGMPNRREFDLRLNLAINNSAKDGSEFGLLYIDLNGFKQINDTHGHDAGDRILQVVACRLLDEFRANDAICRIGGDEFVAIILNGGAEASLREFMRAIADRLAARIAETIIVDDVTLNVDASFGAAVFPGDGAHATALLKTADRNMFCDKRGSDSRDDLRKRK